MWNKNFFLLWQGVFVSSIGTQLFNFALLYWVLEVTGSATQMGLVLMAAAIPSLLLGPFAGTLADNVSRKLLIVWADVLRGAAGIGFVLILWYGDSSWAMPALIVTQILFGIGTALFNPAVGASIPELVEPEHLTGANSVIQGTNALTSTATYGIGGFLYAAIGAPWLFFVNGVTYLCSALSECFIKLRHIPPKVPLTRANLVNKFKTETADGVRYVIERRGLSILILLLGLLNFVMVPVSISVPIFVRDFLERGPEFLGILASIQAVGSLLGFVLMGSLKVKATHRAHLVLGTMAVLGLIVTALGLTLKPFLILPLIFMYGFLLPVMNIPIISLIQATTPNEIRGRVVSVLSTLVLALIPISQGFSGILIDALNQQIPTLFTGIGLITFGTVVVTSASKALRDYLKTDYESSVSETESAT